MNQIRVSLVIASIMCTSFLFVANATERLSLEQVQQEVLSSNLDLAMAYENFYQAQQRKTKARMDMLPRLDFVLIYNASEMFENVMGWLYLVPTPTDWFRAKSQGHMATAKNYSYKAARLNMMKQVTNDYYAVKLHERKLESYEREKRLLSSLLRQYQDQKRVGADVDGRIFETKRSLLVTDQKITSAKALIEEEKASLNIALDRPYDNPLELEEIDPDSVTFEALPTDVAIAMAYDNSNELKQNHYTRLAVKNDMRATRWSVLTFSGIGFEYASLIRFEKSKARVVDLEEKQIRNQISNQVAFALKDYKLLEQRIANERDLLAVERKVLQEKKELHDMGQLDLDDWTDARIYYMRKKEGLNALKYERLVKINQINRLLGYREISSTSYQSGDDEVGERPGSHESSDFSEFDLSSLKMHYSVHPDKENGRLDYILTLAGENLDEIRSVTYDFKRFTRIRNNYRNGFELKFNSGLRYNEVLVKIRMRNGKVKYKKFEIIF